VGSGWQAAVRSKRALKSRVVLGVTGLTPVAPTTAAARVAQRPMGLPRPRDCERLGSGRQAWPPGGAGYSRIVSLLSEPNTSINSRRTSRLTAMQPSVGEKPGRAIWRKMALPIPGCVGFML